MPNFDSMRLRVPELLEERGLTAYALAKASDGRLSQSTAHRLARGEWKCLSSDVLEALCDVLEIDDPGPLFERDAARRRRAKR